MVAGAIAASATPLKHVLRSSNAFYRIVTDVYRNVSARCPEIMSPGSPEISRVVGATRKRLPCRTARISVFSENLFVCVTRSTISLYKIAEL